MKKFKILTIIFLILFLFVFFIKSNQKNALFFHEDKKEYPSVNFSPDDRILILAPHPDDEMLACGGVIQQAMKKNLPIKIAFLTYGDNNQWSFFVYRKHPVLLPKAVQRMGLLRHQEAIAASKKLGLSESHLTFLGYPDFRTLEIWYSHWGDSPPAESMLTQVNKVPYPNALHPKAAYKGEEILNDIKTVILDFNPTKIFLSHPYDHHPDHQSLYLFTRIALWDLEPEIKPELFPYLVHYVKWPQPMIYDPQLELLPPHFLEHSIAWKRLNLTPEEIAKKHDALKEHHSQYQSSPKYLRRFMRSNELFGDYPVIALKEKTASIALDTNRDEQLDEKPEQLLEEEKASFVGIESTAISLENKDLVFTVNLSRPLGKTVGLSIYAFGYKKGKSFAQMTKIHVKFGAINHKIFNQDKLIDQSAVKIKRTPKQIILKIPLDLLDNPKRILTNARTYIGKVPLDWVAWRVIELQ